MYIWNNGDWVPADRNGWLLDPPKVEEGLQLTGKLKDLSKGLVRAARTINLFP